MDISMTSTENLWIWMANFISTASLHIYQSSVALVWLKMII